MSTDSDFFFNTTLNQTYPSEHRLLGIKISFECREKPMLVTNKELRGLIYKTVCSAYTKTVGCAQKPKTAYTMRFIQLRISTPAHISSLYNHSPPRKQGTVYPALFKPTTINGQCKAAHECRSVTFLTNGTLQSIISEKKKKKNSSDKDIEVLVGRM